MDVSIIIPTLNRAKELEKLLISIERNVVDSCDFEVIIVDNGSTDQTKSVFEDFEGKIKNLKYIYDAEPGLLTGRHAGINEAKSEILAFLDDDVDLNNGYIQNLKNLFETHKDVHFATGPCLPDYEIEQPDWLTNFWSENENGKFCGWLSLLDFGNSEKYIDPNFVWGLNFCCRKSSIVKLGGFHPDCIPQRIQQYQGDGETGLTMKAVASGLKAIYSPGLLLHHLVPKERLIFSYFKKRAFYQGVCNSYTHQRSLALNEETKDGFNLKKKISPIYHKIKNIINNVTKEYSATDKMFKELQKIENDGFKFHLKHFKADKKVREWVLKNNYWDYKLKI
jgi:glycosyltransferase involved in cell wall biosynthesis